MRVVPRSSRALAALLLPLLVATCTEEPIGPAGRVGFAQLAVHAEAPNAAQFAGLTIDFVQAVITKPNATLDKLDTLANRTVPFPPDANTIQLGITLLLSQAVDTVTLTLNYLSGATVLFSGSEQIEVRQGPAGANQVPTVPMSYIGPGANVTTLDIQPRDTILTEGGSLQFRVTALDVQGASVPQFYVGWSSTSAGNVINAAGVLRAGSSRSTFYIRAMTPDSVWDSTRVSVVPAPASVQVQSGNGQTALISTALPLPLVVLVRGSDNLPVPGVPVTFAAATGGGSVDTAIVTTDIAGLAGTTVVLGAASGQQSFTATVQGRPAVTFTATASPTIGPASQLFISTAPSATAASGVALVQQPVIQLRDAASQNVSQAGVAVTAAIATGSGVVSGTTVVTTNANGQAVFTNLVLSGIVGPRTLRFTAPSLTPATSGAVTLGVGPATSFLIQAGGGQAAIAGTPVAIPPAVVITDNGGNGVAGINVTFAVATGGGTVVPTTPVATLTTGIAAATSWTLGAAPGPNTLTATAPGVPGSPLTFTATGTALTGPLTWTGAVSTDWSAAGNWTPALVPTGADQVVIPATARTPQLSARSTAAQVTVNGGRLDLAGHTLQIAGSFSTTGTGFLAMQLAADSLIVGGDATFDGAGESGELTNGTLVVAGNFTQAHSTSTTSFVAGINHRTTFNGTTLQTVTAADTTGAQFGILDLRNTTGVSFASLVGVLNSVSVASGARVTATDTTLLGTGLDITGSLVTAPGSTIELGRVFVGGTVNIGGSYAIKSITFDGSGQAIPSNLPYRYLYVTNGSSSFAPGSPVIQNQLTVQGGGVLTLSGNTTVSNGSVFVVGGSSLVINGRRLAMSGGLHTSTGGTITMTNALDTVVVAGGASFVGGSEAGRLTAGAIVVAGNFDQIDSTSALSYAPSGTHGLILNGAGPQAVSFLSPGRTSSAIQDLVIGNTAAGGGVVFGASATLLGGLTFGGGAPTVLHGTAGPSLTLVDLNLNGATFDNVLVRADSGTLTRFDNVTFSGYAPTAVPLIIRNFGGATPFTMNALTFLVTPTTGFYLRANDLDGPLPNTLTVTVLGSTPANGDPFISRLNGAVVNWGTPPTSNWVGTTNAWNLASNWNPAVVPTGTTDVLIPAGTPSVPTITTSGLAVNNLTVATGATLAIPSGTLLVNGDIDAQGTVTVDSLASAFSPNGAGRTIRGTIENVNVLGTYTVNGPLNIIQDLIVRGDLSVADQTVTIGQDLSLFSAGSVTMTNPAGVMTIARNAFFTGGSTAGHLTAGRMDIGGNLTQNNSGTGAPSNSFSPSGSHTTRLTGSGTQTIDIFNTGLGATLSHFNNLDLSVKPGGVVDQIRFNTTFVEGNLISNPSGAPPTLTTSNTGQLQVAGVNVNGLVLDALPLTISGGTITAFNRVTLQGYLSTDNQLTVNHVGAAAPFVFDQLTFATTPTTGRYLVATDADGVAPFLTVDLTNPIPATDGGLTSINNGAVIRWPVSVPFVSWTGATDNNWNNPANWSGGTVPVNTDDVVIPAGMPFDPALSGSIDLHNLTVNGGARLTSADYTINLSGNLDAPGAVAGCCSINMSGAAVTARGNLEDFTLNIDPGAVVTLTGDLLLTQVQSTPTINIVGELVVNGHTLGSSNATLTTSGATGLLTMTNPADQVIARFATFDGGDETGHLTAGLLDVRQDFVQDTSFNQASFAAAAAHTTRIGFGHGGSIRFASAGPSGFHNLIIDPSDGTTQLLNNLFVGGNFTGTDIGTIQVDSFVISVFGSLDNTGPAFSSTTGGLVLVGNGTVQGNLSGIFPLVSGTYQLSGNVIGDTLGITSGDLAVNGHTLDLLSIDVINSGTLTMTDPRDTVFAGDFASFAGGSTAGHLTNGVLILLGDFVQGLGGSPAAFAPSGNHLTVLGGTTVQNVNFFNPGATASHFQNVLDSNAVGGVTVDSVFVLGTAAFASTVPQVIHGIGGNSRLVLSNLDIDGATFDNLGVAMPADGSGTFTQFDNVTFQNAPLDNFTQFQVTAPGGFVAPVTLTFNNLTFTPLTGGNTGLYLGGTSSNGGGLHLVVNGSNVANGPTFSTGGPGVTFTWQ